MRRFKRLFQGLLLLAGLVLAAAVVFVSTADFNDDKATIAGELKAATGRDVTIVLAIVAAGGKQPPALRRSGRFSGSGKVTGQRPKKKGLLQHLDPFE